jgi:hypothetical protein
VRSLMPGVTLQEAPDRSERERQDDPLGLGEVERALQGLPCCTGVLELLPRPGLEQQRPRSPSRTRSGRTTRCAPDRTPDTITQNG